jgi:hypothetical protein
MAILSSGRINDAIQTVHKFGNHYGLLVTQSPDYGKLAPGLYQVAMLTFAEGTDTWSFCYQGGPTNVAPGYINFSQLATVIANVTALTTLYP